MVSHLSTTSFLPYIKNYNVVKDNKKTTDSNFSNETNGSGNNLKDDYNSSNSGNSSCIDKFLSSQSSDINISDILKDFKATMTAVAVPKSIGNEIMGQLKEVHIQASTEAPQIQAVQSSLRNAAQILDKYISDSLGKNSSVVMHWIDTLLMQKINYKAYDPLPTQTIKNVVNDNNLNFDKSSLNSQFSKHNNDAKLQHTDDMTNYIETNSTESIKLIKYKSDSSNLKDVNKNQEEKKYYTDKNIENPNTTNPNIPDKTRNNKNLYKKYFNLADSNDKKGKFKEALAYYNKALALANKENNSSELAKLHYNMGSIYDDLNMIPEAIIHYNASLGYDGETDNIEGQTLTLNNLGCIYSTTKDYDKALDIYKVAYSLTKQTNNTDAKANILSNLGNIYNDINDTNKALRCLQKSLEIDKQNNNLLGYTKTLVNIGKIYAKDGNNTKANKYYGLAISNADSLNDPYVLSMVYEKLNN